MAQNHGDNPFRKIDMYVAKARADAGAPAAGAVVMIDGEIIGVAVDGLRARGRDVAVEVGDPWHLGSITKSMTATLVARLVERGVVAWDDTIGAVLGDEVPDMRAEYRDATLRHLLWHRAGLPKDIPPDVDDFGQHPADPIADRRKWVRVALSQAPVGPLEEMFEYSNSGYVVAGAMLEARTGESWETLIRAEVFGPLGLDSAGFGPPVGTGELGAPRGHGMESGELSAIDLDVDNPAAMSPAGRVHMSLADLARYADVHRRRDSDFLRPASYDMLQSPPFEGDYAMGWLHLPKGEIWHNGQTPFWYAEVAFRPESGRVVAVVVNDGDLERVGPPIIRLFNELMNATTDAP